MHSALSQGRECVNRNGWVPDLDPNVPPEIPFFRNNGADADSGNHWDVFVRAQVKSTWCAAS
jgi:hypothetical protein